MSKKYDVWFSFGIIMELEDPDDFSDIAQRGREMLVDRIQSDSIAENIEDVVKLDDDE